MSSKEAGFRGGSSSPEENDDRCRGFSLRAVCWGYRDVFANAIDHLFSEGYLGEGREEVTAKFFEVLKSSRLAGFDHVLKEFLKSLNPRTRWIVELPEVFAQVADLGLRFAESKAWHGTSYFSKLGEGGFGDTPEHVRDLVSHLRRLREVDAELAVAFLKGYRRLIENLRPREIELYVDQGLSIHARSPAAAASFMEGATRGADNFIRDVTRECRLPDVRPALVRLVKALTGREVEVAGLGGLDSDELLERGSRVVCMYRWLHLPARLRLFDDAGKNRNWYVLTAVTAAGMLAFDSFPRIHGHPDYPSCRALSGDGPLETNLFQILEYVRTLRRIREVWPGARRLLDFGIETELRERSPESAADRLFFDVLSSREPPTRAVETVRRVADECVNCFATARRLRENWANEVASAYPGLDRASLRAFAFLPDMLFRGEASLPPASSVVADLKRKGRPSGARDDSKESDRDEAFAEKGGGDQPGEGEKGPARGVGASFVYDEWDHVENDYHPDHCLVSEKRPEAPPSRPLPSDALRYAADVRKVFEQLKPDLTRREKYLPDGDVINADLLVEYVVQRRNEPAPKVRFYEKPATRERRLAVLILLDVSGSTSEEVARPGMSGHPEVRTALTKVIEIEKLAALVLGEGLSALGDRFAVCGFSGMGRQRCEYFVYKDFDERWDRPARSRVLAAAPSSSTRMGAALRHSGYRLSRVESRTRLVIVVTDGKPMDSGYDPATGYAQHDVRMACEENRRKCIHTFCISTNDDALADMGVMFPGRRYAVLRDAADLPRVLPRLYIRLTAS